MTAVLETPTLTRHTVRTAHCPWQLAVDTAAEAAVQVACEIHQRWHDITVAIDWTGHHQAPETSVYLFDILDGQGRTGEQVEVTVTHPSIQAA